MNLIILTRTTRRPNYFSGLAKSIYNQSARDRITWIVGYERKIDLSYIESATNERLKPITVRLDRKGSDRKNFIEAHGLKLRESPYNLHLNELMRKAIEIASDTNDYYIMYLDDDDCFATKDAVEKILIACKQNNGKVIQWRVDFHNKIIPPDEHWLKPPKVYYFSGIGFAHPLSYHDDAKWDELSCSDFRVANRLVEKFGNVYESAIYTKIQRKKAGGNGRMDDIDKQLSMKNIFSYGN